MYAGCSKPQDSTSEGAVLHSKLRGEEPGLIPGRVCRPSRLEFSVVFSETHINTGCDPLGRPPRRALLPKDPGPTCGQLTLSL